MSLDCHSAARRVDRFSWVAPASRIALCCLITCPLIGCDYGSPHANLKPAGKFRPPPGGLPGTAATRASTSKDEAREAALLKGIIQLLQTAALTPAGSNFTIATEQLNQYFQGSSSLQDYKLRADSRQYLLGQGVPEEILTNLESSVFELSDARHIEDCLMYYTIASRVAPEGDDLSRARKIFEWINQQVQLVPAGTLAPGSLGLAQAQARPYDVLLRGMATEEGGLWSERGWLFMVLCRQIGLDVGLLTYQPRNRSEAIGWVCGVLADKKVYLFDQRIGMPVPSPDGQGVATLEQAVQDPLVLAQLDLPGQSPYMTTQADLAASKFNVLTDSSPGFMSPKMELLQKRLAGQNRMVLFRDPADQAARFQSALGQRLDHVALWEMPIAVMTMLFTDPKYVTSIQETIKMFDAQLPLLGARLAQLRGETDEAIPTYVQFRFAKDLQLRDLKTPVPKVAQDALDMYATYFLGLCHLERGTLDDARLMFEETLRLLPAPGPNQPIYNMFRWGAAFNLARIEESQRDYPAAIRDYCRRNPTMQLHGNLLRARNLVWADPLSPAIIPPTPPPPPTYPTTAPSATSAPAAAAAPNPGDTATASPTPPSTSANTGATTTTTPSP